jgi:hypothetical protein
MAIWNKEIFPLTITIYAIPYIQNDEAWKLLSPFLTALFWQPRRIFVVLFWRERANLGLILGEKQDTPFFFCCLAKESIMSSPKDTNIIVLRAALVSNSGEPLFRVKLIHEPVTIFCWKKKVSKILKYSHKYG